MELRIFKLNQLLNIWRSSIFDTKNEIGQPSTFYCDFSQNFYQQTLRFFINAILTLDC